MVSVDLGLLILGGLFFVFLIIFLMVLGAVKDFGFRDFIGSIAIAIIFLIVHIVANIIFSEISNILRAFDNRFGFDSVKPATAITLWIITLASFSYWKESRKNKVLTATVFALTLSYILYDILKIFS